jgi:hypothetical protein
MHGAHPALHGATMTEQAKNAIDELFDKAPAAPMNGKGSYLSGDGEYVITLLRAFVKKKFGGGNVFVLEFKIDESNNAAYPPGVSKSWTTKIENPNSFGDIKALMFAATGTDPRSVKESDTGLHTQATALARAACGSPTAIAEIAAYGVPANFLEGRKARLSTQQIKTRNTGNDFTVHKFAPYAPTQAAA